MALILFQIAINSVTH